MAQRGKKYKNWNIIKTDFVVNGSSIQELHEKYNISRPSISKRKITECWEKLREEFLSTTFRENIKEAQIVYVRDRKKEAAKFAGLKRILKEAIMMIKLNEHNLKDMADLARAICMLEEREAVLNDEASQVTEGRFSANIQQVVADLGGLTREELQKKFQEEKKRLAGAGSGMASLPEPEKKKEDK